MKKAGFLLLCALAAGSAGLSDCRAGIVVTKKGGTETGTVKEDGDTVVLSGHVNITYEKSKLLWWSDDDTLKTRYEFAKKALVQGNKPAALALFRVSVKRKEKNADDAQKQADELEKQGVKIDVAAEAPRDGGEPGKGK